jgi:hypothetical protein
MSLRSIFKGWIGGVQGTLAKKIFLDPQVYVDINNITIPTPNGTTQIDHVIVSRYGRLDFRRRAPEFKRWTAGSVALTPSPSEVIIMLLPCNLGGRNDQATPQSRQ